MPSSACEALDVWNALERGLKRQRHLSLQRWAQQEGECDSSPNRLAEEKVQVFYKGRPCKHGIGGSAGHWVKIVEEAGETTGWLGDLEDLQL